MKTSAAWIKKSIVGCQDDAPIINTTAVMLPGLDHLPEYAQTIHVDLNNFNLYISVVFFPEDLLKKMRRMHFTSFKTDETVYVDLNAVRTACEKWWTPDSVKQLSIIENRIRDDLNFQNTFRKLREEMLSIERQEAELAKK